MSTTPSISINAIDQRSVTVEYYNYTSAENDTLVITSSGSPTVTLVADDIVANDSTRVYITYFFSDFLPKFDIIIDTSYTLTLNYPTGNSTTTTFILSALGTTPDFTVTNVSANGFEITNSKDYTLNVGDTLNITSANNLGSTIYGVYQIQDTDTQLNRTYTLGEFILTPSNFSLTVDTQYYLILAPVVGGYFNPRSKSLSYSSSSSEASITIASQSVTENGFTVSFSNYTSVPGDTLVITPPNSSSPTLILGSGEPEGGGDITYLYTDFNPDLATAVNTTYTVTLNYSGNTKTATTTFILNATNTTPTFTVTGTSNGAFTITDSSFSVQVNDTLKIKDSTGTILYASYAFTLAKTLNSGYALYEFNLTPSNFTLQDNVIYKLTLAPFVSGYFNSVTKDLSYSPPSADPSITIASQSVTENGFTVSFSNYTSRDGDLIAITPPSSNSPGINLAANDITGSGDITYLYSAFIPPLATEVNTTYTVTLTQYYSTYTKTATTTFILNATNTTPTFTVATSSNNEFTITNSSFSVQANNTLKIRDSTGTTVYASYAFSAGQTLNGTYALSAFTRTPSNFVLGDNVTYKITIAPFVPGYFNSVTNNLSYSPAPPDASITIASQSVTENGFTVSFSDYTSVPGDTLVITQSDLADAPSLTLGSGEPEGGGDITYQYIDFSPNLAIAVNTTYTLTLNYSGNTKTTTTTFILNATNTTPTFTVAANSNSGFTISNSTFSVQKNDTLKIRDSAGTTVYASYAFSAGQTLNGTYALSVFTRTPSNFVLGDNVTYKITIAPFVSGYFNSVTNNLSYSPAPPDASITIASQTVTENGFTVSFSNYTSANGDTLVITPPSSSSPSLTLAVNDVTGSGDKAYLYSAFSPSLATAVNTTYTVTLRYSSNTKTATATFVLNATNTTPSFTVIAGKNNEFTISNSTYTVQKNDTLKIKDSTGTTQYATYAFSGSRSLAGTYALSAFTRTPSNFVLQDNVVYKFILAPYVAGYFNSVTKNLTFSPPSVSISNVAATGFTVRFSNYVSENNDTLSLTGSGITTAPKITYSTSPNTVNAPAGTPQTKNYTFTGDFSPSFTLALDTTYTATLRISGGTAVSATTYFTKSSPSAPCFREGSQILCDISGVETYRAIETLRPGTLVKTLTSGLVPIEMIGYTKLKNPGHSERIQNRLYKCSKANYPTLNEDLYITGCHSILEGYMSETQKEATIVQLGRLFVTEGKYRLMACIDERATPHVDEAEYTIWHIALENTEYYKNYGVWANGLLVETCSKRYLKELSGMTLVV